MKIVIALIFALISASSFAGDLYLNLGLGEEVISDNWSRDGVDSAVGTIELEYRIGDISVAWEHQSLLGEGWPANSRGEITIDEIQLQVDKRLAGNFSVSAAIGWEALDSNVSAATGSLELYYSKNDWTIGLQRKSLMDDQFFQSNDNSVIQLRISRRIHLFHHFSDRRF